MPHLVRLSIGDNFALNYLQFVSSFYLLQGGSAQVRFQPITGHQLAAASDKVVSIFDVENDRQLQSFQVHRYLPSFGGLN